MREVADSIDGQLPDSKQTLFTVPSCLNFFIKFVVLVNSDGADTTAELWINRGGDSRRIIRPYPLQANGDLQGPMFIALTPGNLIEGRASTAEKVDYVISYVMQLEN